MSLGCHWLAALLIDKKILDFVLKEATEDEDVTIKITSLRCLQEMCKVEQLRTVLQNNCNFYVSLFDILYSEIFR